MRRRRTNAAATRSFAWIAVVYTIFMFVAAGLKYVLLVTVLFAPGTILYVWARREQNARLFTPVELGVFAVTLVAGRDRRLRPRDRPHHALNKTKRIGSAHMETQVRRAFGGWPTPQGDGLRAGTRASAPDAQQLR